MDSEYHLELIMSYVILNQLRKDIFYFNMFPILLFCRMKILSEVFLFQTTAGLIDSFSLLSLYIISTTLFLENRYLAHFYILMDF